MKRSPSIVLAFFLLACSSGQEYKDIERQLVGQWQLDTSVGKSNRIEKLEFKTDNDYSNEWWHGDVGNTFTGKYFINLNPKRGLPTITFIPDLQFTDHDTVRIDYENFDIIKLDAKQLEVIYATKFEHRDSLKALTITVRQTYNRVR